jgi:hypothetical protein
MVHSPQASPCPSVRAARGFPVGLLVVVILLGSFSLLTPFVARGEGGDSTAFFVSSRGDDAWSGTLPVPNASGTDGPFLSLWQARDAVRLSLAEGNHPCVFIREGRYRFDYFLLLVSTDSGTEDHPVIWRPTGAKPSGSREGEPWADFNRYRTRPYSIGSVPWPATPCSSPTSGARGSLTSAYLHRG